MVMTIEFWMVNAFVYLVLALYFLLRIALNEKKMRRGKTVMKPMVLDIAMYLMCGMMAIAVIEGG